MQKAWSVLSGSVCHWYAGGFHFFSNKAVGLLRFIDRFFAVRINFFHIFQPLYQDRTFLGYFFGFFTRLFKVVSGGVVLAVPVPAVDVDRKLLRPSRAHDGNEGIREEPPAVGRRPRSGNLHPAPACAGVGDRAGVVVGPEPPESVEADAFAGGAALPRGVVDRPGVLNGAGRVGAGGGHRQAGQSGAASGRAGPSLLHEVAPGSKV